MTSTFAPSGSMRPYGTRTPAAPRHGMPRWWRIVRLPLLVFAIMALFVILATPLALG